MSLAQGQSRRHSPAGDLLREWRGLRGKTQIDLSFDAGVSQKHISFVESGRSVPTRQMLIDLAQALDIPLRERNTLLVAAGYAPIYPDDAITSPQMSNIKKALERILHQHEPFPAVVMDRYWNVLIANSAVSKLFGCFVDMALRKDKRNLLHLMFDPQGMRPFIQNWDEIGPELLARVYRESLGGVIDFKTRELLDTLLKYQDVRTEWRKTLPAPASPMIPFSFVKNGVSLNYFSMVTTLGTPQAVTAQELRLECMFPADEQTERLHERFIAENSVR